MLSLWAAVSGEISLAMAWMVGLVSAPCSAPKTALTSDRSWPLASRAARVLANVGGRLVVDDGIDLGLLPPDALLDRRQKMLVLDQVERRRVVGGLIRGQERIRRRGRRRVLSRGGDRGHGQDGQEKQGGFE